MSLKIRVRIKQVDGDFVIIPTFYGEDLDDIQTQVDAAIRKLKERYENTFTYELL